MAVTRVLGEIAPSGLTLSSSFEEWCAPAYLSNPYTYITKDTYNLCIIDYIGYHGAVSPQPGSCRREHGALLFCFNDHYSLTQFLSIAPSSRAYNVRRRALPCDPKLVGDPTREKSFADSICALPAIPFETEPTTYCVLLESIIVDSLASAYPIIQQNKQRKECVTDCTHQFTVARNEALRSMERSYNAFWGIPMLVLFKAWSGKRRLRWSLIFGLLNKPYIYI